MERPVLIPETNFEHRVIDDVHIIKDQCTDWRDPAALAQALGFRAIVGSLGKAREGASLEDVIIVSHTEGTPERRKFTFYHEIVHGLIRRNEKLLSDLHEQFPTTRDLVRILEHLSSVGAAEFLIPRSEVLEQCRIRGHSVAVIVPLQELRGASATAVCVQLALTASHRCVALIARHRQVSAEDQTQLLPVGKTGLAVELAVSSRSMPYRVPEGTAIEAGHLLHSIHRGPEGEIVKGKARIPFRRATRWLVDCEAVRFGSQVFSIFQPDPQPQIPDERQTQLSL